MGSGFNHGRKAWIVEVMFVTAMTTAACSTSQSRGHGHAAAMSDSAAAGREHSHGNPADLESYLARMEAPERATWQKPDEVIAELSIAPGSVACDIGAGPGYFSLRLGKAVGQEGLVFAVDVDPRILGVLRDRIELSGLRNIVPVLSLPDDPLVPAGACDLVLMVNTLHHLPEPVAYLERLRRSLKPGGRIVNIDFHKRPSPMGPPVESRIDRDDFVALAEKAGLLVSAEHDLLLHHYFIEVVAKQ